MMYCNCTIDSTALSEQIHNTFIVIPKNYSTSIVILLYNISTVILHYILVIKFHQSIVKSQAFLTVYIPEKFKSNQPEQINPNTI